MWQVYIYSEVSNKEDEVKLYNWVYMFFVCWSSSLLKIQQLRQYSIDQIQVDTLIVDMNFVIEENILKGVEMPIDTGRKLGQLIYNALNKNPDHVAQVSRVNV